MKNEPSRILTVMTRIILLMVVFGLLSQAAQACVPPKSNVAMASMSDSEPCQVTGEDTSAHTRCAPGDQAYADDCAAPTPAAVSSDRIPASPAPVATADAQPQAPPVRPFLTVVLAAPPPDSSRPRIPLSILHCSFQI
jgi:hypothetical protein